MTKFEDEPVIDLDNDMDEDFNDYSSFDESGSEEDEEEDLHDNKEAGEENLKCDKRKHLDDLTAEDIKDIEFGSEEEATKFYYSYARCHGFMVRKDVVGRDQKGKIVMRQFVCNRGGLRNKKHFLRVDRRRDHRPISRTKCKAKFRVRISYKTSKWKVVSFVETHNHKLTPSNLMHIIPQFRVLSDVDKAQVDNLHSLGIKTCHIMGYMLSQKGSYVDLGFSIKDLYNYLHRQKLSKIKDGDASAALSYLHCKANNDPMFYSHYVTTSDGKLKSLFWADGGSISDYQCFGDVLAFDATYKKNKYNYPLVIFSGCNHHSQTVIFGCALVSDETIDTYKWVLESFLHAMGNKQPIAVVTDGDGAMKEAIKQVFPDSTHRLCAWHLHKNACENVKNSSFLDDFRSAMYHPFTPEEFEEFWKKIVVKHGVELNKWVQKTYENRFMWATAYLRDKFFGRIRTTSQCEAINALIKNYIRKKNSILEFLHNFEAVVRLYRNNELMADYKSNFLEPVMTTSLEKIELEASKIFTMEMFKEVKKQIEDGCSLNVVERVEKGDQLMFRLNKYCNRDSLVSIVFDRANYKFSCECPLFQSRGIPCSHMICVMKNEHLDHIPASLICKRWTKNAKKDLISYGEKDGVDYDVMKVARFGAVGGACKRLCDIAAQKGKLFNEIMDDILKLTDKYEKKADGCSMNKAPVTEVDDPMCVKTKGAPKKKKFGKKKRRCSNCKSTGHIKRTCPRLLGTDDENEKDEELSPTCSIVKTKDIENDKEKAACTDKGEEEPNATRAGKRKEKVSISSKKKQKKNLGISSSPKSGEHSKMQHLGNKDEIPQVMSVNPTAPNLSLGLGTSTQVPTFVPSNSFPFMPYYGGVAYYPQMPTVPIIPQYVGGGQQYSCWNNLLQEQMRNFGQSSVDKDGGNNYQVKNNSTL